MAAKKRLGDMLVEAGVVRPEQLRTALQMQAVFGGQLGKTLVRLDVLTEDGLVRFLAAQLNLAIADLSRVDPAVAQVVPRDLCIKLGVFPVATKRDRGVDWLALAMADPTNLEAVDAVSFQTGRRVVTLIATETEIERAIREHFFGERRAAPVAAQSPVQFRGNEIDLEAAMTPTAPVPAFVPGDMTPAVPVPAFAPLSSTALPRTQTASADLPVITGVLDLSTIETVEEPDVTFSAIQEPLSVSAVHDTRGWDVEASSDAPAVLDERALAQAAAATETPVEAGEEAQKETSTGPAIAEGPPIVRSTGVPPETPMAKIPEQLAAAPFCPDCGASRVPGAKFCPHCGLSFTGAQRAKGAPPTTPPATKPMMTSAPSAALASAVAAFSALGAVKQGEPVDVDLLEGLRSKGTLIQLPPRTASAANVDEPAQLAQKEAPVGLGVTTLVPSVVTDASNPDDPSLMIGGKRAHAPVAPMHLHLVTNAMAHVDDLDALTAANGANGANARGNGTPPPPPNGKLMFPPRPAPGAGTNAAPPSGLAARTVAVDLGARPAALDGKTVIDASPFGATVLGGAPVAAKPVHAAGNGINALDLGTLEGVSRTSTLSATAALCDDVGVLTAKDAFKIALGVTHMAAVLADAALVDDVAVLAGGVSGKAAPSTHITRDVLHADRGHSVWGAARVDDIKVLTKDAPARNAPAASAKVSLAKDWADVAERPIPRKDDRTNVPVPKAREVFFAPDAASLPPPPPPPEPKVEYVPAPPAAAAAPAPWAAFATPAAGVPQPPAPEAKQGPGLATMIMSLDDVQKQELAEKLRVKAEQRAKEKK